MSAILYKGHIPTNWVQKSILAIGSGVSALVDPWRADSVAVQSEVWGQRACKKLRDKIRSDPEGAQIMKERPIINSNTVDFKNLIDLPPNTLGYAYAKYNDKWKISPDSRAPVRFVDEDEELAYIILRYRHIHDLIHTILNMPTNMVGEVAVKWIEGQQTRLPMCISGSLLGPLRFTKKQADQYESLLPWIAKTGSEARLFMNIYFEKRWDQDITDFRQEMRVKLPPQYR
uniref:Ubiquinone biosynthesis protein COQ4 homolog, mitochondrial n=2 Tax=Lepeophtheirus salmonis TaxID=72036 RepID=C1BT58_LEPSM|nr:Ubiquinone biosynthesis protein COQ4 homolog [Lepeophtheirus salmonis]